MLKYYFLQIMINAISQHEHHEFRNVVDINMTKHRVPIQKYKFPINYITLYYGESTVKLYQQISPSVT